ncbi:MAG: signal peptidase I [Coriobacteriia bacterium]|nr:signal peptidase I [Coriobacteriia bacterium]
MNQVGNQPGQPQVHPAQQPVHHHPAYQPGHPPHPQPVQVAQAPVQELKDTRGITGRWLVETAALVLLAFVIAMGVRWILVEPYRIPTGSMIPTIQIDDHILIYRLGTHLGYEPKPQDVVVFYDPTEQFPNLVKRVIATEGQVITLTPEGRVQIDGTIIDEPYVLNDAPTFPLQPDTNLTQPLVYPYTVPAGHIFVMGDNRQRSSDSRAFGSIPVSDVKGVAFFTYWPLSHIAPLE